MGRRDLDLDVFLEEVRDALAAAAPAGVTVTLAPVPPDTRVVAGPARLEQVLISLGLNALDAVAEAGGEVQLSAAPCVREGSPGIVLSIRDTGAGMSDQVLAQAFDPFFSTRGRSGLGLATARQVVASLDGTLSIETGPGDGTTVRVALPCPEESVEDPTSVRPDRGPCEVLVVEDEDGVRTLVGAVLRRAGFRVREASTAEEALTSADPVDLLITDLTLEGLSGNVLAQRMRADHPGLRVLYISGHTGAAVTGAGVDVEGPEFLQKPFTPDILVDRVRRVLR